MPVELSGVGRLALRDPGLAVLHSCTLVHCRFYHTTQPLGEWETHGVKRREKKKGLCVFVTNHRLNLPNPDKESR